MKKLMICLFATALMAGSTAFADDARVSLGLKLWSNTWEEEIEEAGTTETIDFGSSLMVGPALNVRFSNNWFAGISFLQTTKDYEAKDLITSQDTTGTFTSDTFSAKRQDLDLTAGYMFSPRWGLFFGYKSITADATVDAQGQFFGTPFSITTSAEIKLTGPGIGVLGNYPFSDTLALYGSLAVMSIKSEFSSEGESSSTDQTGASFEIGLGFVLTDAVSGNVGIKSQSFTGEDEGVTSTDTFTGLTAGINYTF